MGSLVFLVFVIVAGIVIAVVILSTATPEQREQMVWGPLNPHMVCPHCSTTGHVHTIRVTRKKGISGGKAAAAVLTGGLSMVATGLSRKENNTQAHCGKCKNTWFF